MHQSLEPRKPDPPRPLLVSRRTLLEGGTSATFAAVSAGWGSGLLHPDDAGAANPVPGDPSSRQMAAFRIRQAAAQAYLDEPEPAHQSNGDEKRYPDEIARFQVRIETSGPDTDLLYKFVSERQASLRRHFENLVRRRLGRRFRVRDFYADRGSVTLIDRKSVV